MLETYLVSFGVAVSPICVAEEKYSRISRQAESSAALPRWHSSITIRVEEAGGALAGQLLPLLRAGDRLIEAGIDLVSGVNAALPIDGGGEVDGLPVLALDSVSAGRKLRHCRAERPEVVHHRLIDQHVAIGEKQDAFFTARLPQPPDDLEGGVCLAGAGCHDQQNSVAARGNGLNRRVDRIDLVVARTFAATVVEIILKHDLLGLVGQAFPRAIAPPKLGRGRECVEAQGRLGRTPFSGAIVKHEPIAV